MAAVWFLPSEGLGCQSQAGSSSASQRVQQMILKPNLSAWRRTQTWSQSGIQMAEIRRPSVPILRGGLAPPRSNMHLWFYSARVYPQGFAVGFEQLQKPQVPRRNPSWSGTGASPLRSRMFGAERQRARSACLWSTFPTLGSFLGRLLTEALLRLRSSLR